MGPFVEHCERVHNGIQHRYDQLSVQWSRIQLSEVDRIQVIGSIPALTRCPCVVAILMFIPRSDHE